MNIQHINLVWFQAGLGILASFLFSFSVFAQSLTIAAASDLKFALSEVKTAFLQSYPQAKVRVVYGSSGKFAQQIENGAPFDLYFSASIVYPQRLVERGFAATKPQLYALGKIVLWSSRLKASEVSLMDLAKPQFRRIAIANPIHAPYGLAAKAALKSAGVWQAVEPKLVMGENIAQTAQMIEMGGADIGVIALSLALSPRLSQRGGYGEIPQKWYPPLRQAFIVTRYGEKNPLAYDFVKFLATKSAQKIMKKYGFELPQ